MEESGYILVVSDDPRLPEVISASLPAHLGVRSARDARTVSGVIEATPPLGIVVAIRTGNAGGYSLATDMSQKDELRSVPVVILLERPQDRWLALRAGADATLMRSTDPDAIVDQVVALVGEPALTSD